jgi:signal transduction histidine kinase
MISAELPHDELQRLDSLYRLQVLDTAPEAEFDALVRAASLVCGVPFSLISLVDAERQWFKANHGLEGATETPRAVAFCAHAILGNEVFEVPDAQADQRFHDNPLVTNAPSLRFYAGVPLTLSDGARVGTLCVAGQQPHQLTDQQRAILVELSCAAVRALEARRAVQAERESLAAQARANAIIANIFALSPDGFAALDAQGTLTFCSARFAELAQAGTTAFTGRPLADVVQHLAALARDPVDARAIRLQQAPLIVPLRDQPDRVLQLSLHEGHSDALPALLRLQDVSKQHEVDRLKSEFLAVAAHELRTPMTSIFGFAELLLMRQYTPDRQRPLLQKIHSQCRAMMDVTTELLDLSQLEARGGRDLQRLPVDMLALVQATIADFSPPKGREGPQLDVAPGLTGTVIGDPVKLRQVMTNLLSNAFKYSPDGGPVAVRLQASPDAQSLVIEVQDHGMGMTPDQLARVSERFYRADRSGTIMGTGLGMSIVKEIITLHGGQLALASTPGLGTTVTVSLPRQA